MREARSAGTAATTAFWVDVWLSPRAEAIRDVIVGDRTSTISETRLVAIEDTPD
jgi:hypothetical protein